MKTNKRPRLFWAQDRKNNLAWGFVGISVGQMQLWADALSGFNSSPLLFVAELSPSKKILFVGPKIVEGQF